jgi:hypothetical protein
MKCDSFCGVDAPTSFFRAEFHGEIMICVGMRERAGLNRELTLAIPIGGAKHPGL